MSNYRIEVSEIFSVTNGGLDVFRFYISNIDDFVGNNKKFKLREEEKSPSATIKKLSDGNYVLTDFGDSGKPRNAITFVQDQEKLTYGEAIKIIAERHGISLSEGVVGLYDAVIRHKDASPDQKDKEWIFEYEEEIPDTWLEIIFSKATYNHLAYTYKSVKNEERASKITEHLRNLCANQHWVALKSYTIIKERKATTVTSNVYYPIFVIEEEKERGDEIIKFKKIYQPKNKDKSFRFMYYGNVEKNFLHGLAQVQQALEKYRDAQEKENKGDDSFTRTDVKFKEIIFSTGGSDSINLSALGYQSIYPSSEYFKLSRHMLNDLFSIAHSVMTCPDLDSTGQRQNMDLCLSSLSDRFMDIRTIDLPAELKKSKDQYQRPCKDLRDYLKHFAAKDLKNLVKVAKPLRFWDSHQATDREGNPKIKFGQVVYEFKISSERVLNFLAKMGFGRYEMEDENYSLVHVKHNVVRIVTPDEIKGFLIGFLRSRFLSEDLINIVHRSPLLNEASFAQLPTVELDFRDYDKKEQFLFFKNETWNISTEGIKRLKPENHTRYVWEKKILPHDARIVDPMFKVSYTDGHFDMDIFNKDCMFFRFLIQTSRTHWRKELEDNLINTSDQERDAYLRANKFEIKGANLTVEERQDQVLHLLNKMFAFGYLIHGYKQRSKAWAVFAMDDTPNKDGLSHGGTGKSIFFYAVEQLKKMAYLDGKNADIFNKDHALEVVKHDTDFLYVDDTAANFDFERLFSMVTGPMAINPKGKTIYNLPFEASPKISLSSNYTPGKISDSTMRRLLFLGMSNYYHFNTAGEFREVRQPVHDFEKELFKDFTDNEWNNFFNFSAQCCQLFLSHELIEAPMGNIMERNLANDMGMNFLGWAELYFSEESGRQDILVPTSIALNDFQREANQQKIATQTFNHKLDLFSRYKGWKLNPKEVYGKSDRLSRFLEDLKYDPRSAKWFKPGGKKTQSMFYYQTKSDDGSFKLVDTVRVFDPTVDPADLPFPEPDTLPPNF